MRSAEGGSVTGPREFDWKAHAQVCDRCKLVDVELPATVAISCFVGAALLKNALVERRARSRKPRGDGGASPQ